MSFVMKQTKGEKIFSVFNYIILTLIALLALYPFIYVLVCSLSSPSAVAAAKVWIYPKEFTLEAYYKVMNDKQIWIGYGNSFYYTIIGTIVNVLLTIAGAYPLSKKRLRGRKFIAFMVLLTMWFRPGMIPFYLNLKDLGLLNQRITIIIAFACSAFYVILLRTYFESLPEELEESAKMDGANDLLILRKIILPLSTPALATIALYYAVNRWNGYFWSMILLKDMNKIPLQVIIKKLIVDLAANEATGGSSIVSQETIIYTTIIIAALPMIIIYPFIQKYFEKGLMVGSVKG